MRGYLYVACLVLLTSCVSKKNLAENSQSVEKSNSIEHATLQEVTKSKDSVFETGNLEIETSEEVMSSSEEIVYEVSREYGEDEKVKTETVRVKISGGQETKTLTSKVLGTLTETAVKDEESTSISDKKSVDSMQLVTNSAREKSKFSFDLTGPLLVTGLVLLLALILRIGFRKVKKYIL